MGMMDAYLDKVSSDDAAPSCDLQEWQIAVGRKNHRKSHHDESDTQIWKDC